MQKSNKPSTVVVITAPVHANGNIPDSLNLIVSSPVDDYIYNSSVKTAQASVAEIISGDTNNRVVSLQKETAERHEIQPDEGLKESQSRYDKIRHPKDNPRILSLTRIIRLKTTFIYFVYEWFVRKPNPSVYKKALSTSEPRTILSDAIPVSYATIGSDDEVSSACEHSPANTTEPVYKKQGGDLKVNRLPSLNPLPSRKYVKHINIALITEDVVEDETTVAGKKYTHLRFSPKKNNEIYQLFLRNKCNQYPYLKGDLKTVESRQEMMETIEAELKQAREEGATRIVWTIIGHGQCAWKNLFNGNLELYEPNPWFSYFYKKINWIRFSDINADTDDMLKYLRKKAKEYGIEDTHVLLFMCHTYLSGTGLNMYTERFRFSVHHSTSEDFPIGCFAVKFNRVESDTDPRELVVHELDDKVDHTGMDILKGSIKQNLQDERAFESDGYRLVPSQHPRKIFPNTKMICNSNITPFSEEDNGDCME